MEATIAGLPADSANRDLTGRLNFHVPLSRCVAHCDIQS
jgi:hypothetical protein